MFTLIKRAYSRFRVWLNPPRPRTPLEQAAHDAMMEWAKEDTRRLIEEAFAQVKKEQEFERGL